MESRGGVVVTGATDGQPIPSAPLSDVFVARIADERSDPPSTRVITSSYDGLLRLTGASENPGTVYSYTYDLAGNRLQSYENGALVASRSYNAANQVVGWSYDAAGNLLIRITNNRVTNYELDTAFLCGRSY